MRLFHIFTGLVFLLSLSACSLAPKGTDVPGVAPPEEGYQPSEKYGAVSTPDNAKVRSWVKFFTGRGRKHMAKYLARSSRYIPMMKQVFRERGMPEELAYVAMIESGFSSSALSHASAVGYWQFIRGTGKRYNLRIDSYVDERKDPILSTQAAANYLDSLYNLFGDWHLSLAAYNTGENRVKRAVMKYKTRDFWVLASKRRILYRETRNYVPKFVAAVHIARNPEKYGFHNVSYKPQFEFESVVIEKPISLDLLAKALNVPYEDLKRMNPRYRSDYVPVYKDRTNAVRVPVGMRAQALAQLPNVQSSKPKIYVAGFEWYRIRRGDSLGGIARKFRTSMAKIRHLNNWGRKRTFLRAGRKIKVPDAGYVHARKKRTSSRAQASTPPAGSIVYTVQKGDVLSVIAERHGIGLSVLRRANRLGRRSMIRVGQKLIIPNQKSSANSNENGSSSVRVASKSKRKVASYSSKSKRKYHVVRRGENLTTIARKYRTSVAQLTRKNGLSRKATLFAGKKLVIPE